ncbi:MAG: starch-binding protein, partial [Treponema sp.]|nr:starch-binding protein [Treponema sp.]
MKKVKLCSVSALHFVLFCLVMCSLFFNILFVGCANNINDSSSENGNGSKNASLYGSLSFRSFENDDSESRAVYTPAIKTALVMVKGYDGEGKSFSKSSSLVTVSGGKSSGVCVEEIPVCKNAVVLVQAYSDSGSSKIDGILISALTDIVAGENEISVGWESSRKGFVYSALIDAGVNTNLLTSDQISSLNNAIPAETHASLINAALIASSYKAGSLSDSSSYILSAGSVRVTCSDYDGCTLYLSDPLSKEVKASTSSPVAIENAAPGTWKLYVLDGSTVKETKTVNVTSGVTASVTVGEKVITDRIIVHVAESSDSTYNPSSYTHIWVWATSGSTNYCTNNQWPGDTLSDSDNDGWYDYTIKNGSSYVTSSMIILSKAGNPQTSNIQISSAGEYWWNGTAFVTENPALPPEPTLPSVSISPVDGSKISVNGSISVSFTDGNDAISKATVTVNELEFDMGESAGTWTKSLSDLGITGTGVAVNVSASVTNSLGTGSASASLTTKEPNKLVTNPNELRIYQVMVASFQDGDPSIGYSQMWGPDGALKGGDLQGIINALDYISDLGCNALWMTPIFQSNTGDEKLKATGYFANDYFNVDNHFGTNEKFAELVGACHEKGIAVILDGVFGHNAGIQLVASPTRNGIKNPGITPSTSNPVDYAGNEDSLKYYSDVARYWITEYKIDGWRFDQCYQVGLGDKDNDSGKFPVNTGAGGHNYWYDIRKVIEEASASNGTKGVDWGTLGYMVGEHWHGDQTVIQMGSVNAGYTSSSYGDMSKAASGYGLNGCFDFPSYYKVIQGFAQEWGGTTTGNITTGLSYLYQTYSEKGYSCKDDDGTYDIYYPNFMLSNHDLYRIGDLIKKKFSCEYDSEEYTKRNKVLLAAQCAYSGPITIYYGDEIGDHSVDLSGWGGDNVARSSGKITGFNTREQAIHDWTQKCLAARADHEALWNGNNTQITGESDFYVAKKVGGGETVYIAFNYNASSA